MEAFLPHLISSLFPGSKLFLLYINFLQASNSSLYWYDKFGGIVSKSEIISESGGIWNANLEYGSDQRFSNASLERESKSFGELSQVVILFLPEGIGSSEEEKRLRALLHLPLLNPATVKNTNKFIFFTRRSKVKSMFRLNLVERIKYKLFLTEYDVGKGGLQLYQHCLYCPLKERMFEVQGLQDTQILSVKDYFPDFQRNLHGFLLKATATDAMYGDLEFAKDPVTGKDYAKRGIFATILKHLSEGLNFTGETFRSSGGGSTGTPFPNGTWVGSVGDVYYQDATFCMLCSISMSRHTVIDMCSPVTYEYVAFAIGPSEKMYTWQAIFWPFDLNLWMAVLGSFGLTTVSSFIFLIFLKRKENVESKKGTLWVAQYFGRMFLEQSEDLDPNLPQPIRVMMGFWLLFALVATTIYRAKMVTLMTFPVYENAPQNFDELVTSDYNIEFHYFPNIAYNSFKLSNNPVMMSVFQKLIKEPDPVKCMQHTLDSKSVCIMFTSVHEDTINRNLSDRFGQSPIRAAPGYAFLFSPGIVLEKMSIFMENFKWILSNTLQMGLNEWWQRSDFRVLVLRRNEWIRSLPPGEKEGVFQYKEEDDDNLHLRHLKGAFAILWSGGLTACFTMVGENLVSFWKKWREKVSITRNLEPGSIY